MSVINYGANPLQSFKILKRDESTNDSVVFIHGGGWRDPNNTFDDFLPLVKSFDSVPINLISINYRLSPKVKTTEELENCEQFLHPLHLFDVLQALNHIIGSGYNLVSLVGHSVGATLCFQLLHFDKVLDEGFKFVDVPDEDKIFRNSLDFTNQIHLKSLFLIDGIYDVQRLLEEYGESYSGFVRSAFINEDHYIKSSPLSNKSIGHPSKLMDNGTTIYAVHSLEDELISLKQTLLLNDYFEGTKVKHQLLTGNWGLHEEVYTRSEIAELIIQHLDNKSLSMGTDP